MSDESNNFEDEAERVAASLEDAARFIRRAGAGEFSVPAERQAVALRWFHGVERNARRVRELIGLAQGVHEDPPAEYLPFNRKERFFTGTVLPGIVAGDGFAHLQRFLDLCGVPVIMSGDPFWNEATVQFLTEYGFAESAWYDTTGRWKNVEFGRDTPDVVICGSNWILAVEAKLYARQGGAAIASQLAKQRRLLDAWAGVLSIPQENVRLVALLPEKYANELHDLGEPVITWEQVRDAYRGIAQPYWIDVLSTAIDRYDVLKSTFGDKADGKLTGEQIVAQYQAGTIQFSYVGRGGGPSGKEFAEDVVAGAWRSRMYQVRVDPIDATNWWPIDGFVAAVTGSTE